MCTCVTLDPLTVDSVHAGVQALMNLPTPCFQLCLYMLPQDIVRPPQLGVSLCSPDLFPPFTHSCMLSLL